MEKYKFNMIQLRNCTFAVRSNSIATSDEAIEEIESKFGAVLFGMKDNSSECNFKVQVARNPDFENGISYVLIPHSPIWYVECRARSTYHRQRMKAKEVSVITLRHDNIKLVIFLEPIKDMLELS